MFQVHFQSVPMRRSPNSTQQQPPIGLSAQPYLREDDDGVWLNVLVQPRSSRNQLVGRHGDRLKIQVTAPPVDSRANAMVKELLAELLGIPRQAVEIARGLTAREKTVHVRGLRLAQVQSQVEAALKR
jgi:uncharacterized protein (TIGR00251 family)